MVLPSQMPRTTRHVTLRYKERPRRSKVFTAVAVSTLIAAAGLGAWWVTTQQPGMGPSTSEPRQDAAVIPTSDTPRVDLGQPKGPVLPSLERTPKNAPTQSAPTQTSAPVASPIATALAKEPAPVNTVLGSPNPAIGSATTERTTTEPPTTPTTSTTSTSPAPSEPAPGSSNPGSANPSSASPGGAAPSVPISREPVRDPVIQRLVSSAEGSISSGRLAEARATLNRALNDSRASVADEEMLRVRLSELNEQMLFGAQIVPGDPLAETHTVESGDRLVKIVNAYGLKVDWRFIQRINRMSDPGRLRVGQKLKLIRGPFHAVVHKDAYRLDLYSDLKDAEGNRLYVRSFRVGLGEHDSTPLGKWVVRQQSKLVNPHWVNPRTGERFDANDPKNPIGEFWLGLTGIEPATEVLSGYGIHGTIEPESIGRDASMGCVRMQSDDIAMIYELLVEGHSEVEIKP